MFLSIDGQHFEYYDQFAEYLENKKNSNIELNLLRDGNEIVKNVSVSDEGKLGFSRYLI